MTLPLDVALPFVLPFSPMPVHTRGQATVDKRQDGSVSQLMRELRAARKAQNRLEVDINNLKSALEVWGDMINKSKAQGDHLHPDLSRGLQLAEEMRIRAEGRREKMEIELPVAAAKVTRLEEVIAHKL